MLGKSTRCRRVEEATFPHRTAEDLLNCQAVDDRLKRGAAADDRPRRGPIPARLVVGDPKFPRTFPGLDDVDRAAKDEAVADRDRLALAARVASLVVQAEAVFEVFRRPRCPF